MNEAHVPDRLIVEPDDGYQPVLDFIASAKSTLHFKHFKFDAPELVEAVLAAHGRGIKVRAMFNGANFEGLRYNDATYKAFEKAGIAVTWANPAFPVTHEKSGVADGTSAMISTYNFSPKYFTQCRDLGLIVHRPAVVHDIMNCHDADWERRTFVPAAPELVWSNVHSRQKFAGFIDGARKQLDIYHPKYVDLPLLDRIMAARDRGVRVRVLCGGTHGIKSWDLLDTLASLRALRRSGAKVHRTTKLKVHLKLMIADEDRALLGSMNIHRDAFDRRRELGILLSPGPVVERVRLLFAGDWEHSHDYEPPDPLKPETHFSDDLADDPDFVHD